MRTDFFISKQFWLSLGKWIEQDTVLRVSQQDQLYGLSTPIKLIIVQIGSTSWILCGNTPPDSRHEMNVAMYIFVVYQTHCRYEINVHKVEASVPKVLDSLGLIFHISTCGNHSELFFFIRSAHLNVLNSIAVGSNFIENFKA